MWVFPVGRHYLSLKMDIIFYFIEFANLTIHMLIMACYNGWCIEGILFKAYAMYTVYGIWTMYYLKAKEKYTA